MAAAVIITGRASITTRLSGTEDEYRSGDSGRKDIPLDIRGNWILIESCILIFTSRLDFLPVF